MVQIRTNNIAFSSMLVRPKDESQKNAYHNLPKDIRTGCKLANMNFDLIPKNDKLLMTFKGDMDNAEPDSVSFTYLKEGEKNSNKVETISMKSFKALDNPIAVAGYITGIYGKYAERH
jgi:hypothetical protein